jgi:HEPN domain-containing protein
MKERQDKKYLEWFDKGNKDIKSARILLEHDGFPEVISFLSHQALEKYLKGYLLYSDKGIPPIHDIYQLCKKCSAINNNFSEFFDDCKFLNAFYIEVRYPMDFEVIVSDADALKALEIVERIISFIII